MKISKGAFLIIYPMMLMGIFGSYMTSFYDVSIELLLGIGVVLCIINAIISILEWEDALGGKDE